MTDASVEVRVAGDEADRVLADERPRSRIVPPGTVVGEIGEVVELATGGEVSDATNLPFAVGGIAEGVVRDALDA